MWWAGLLLATLLFGGTHLALETPGLIPGAPQVKTLPHNLHAYCAVSVLRTVAGPLLLLK